MSLRPRKHLFKLKKLGPKEQWVKLVTDDGEVLGWVNVELRPNRKIHVYAQAAQED